MDILEKEIWKTQYVQPLFDKYKEVPTKLKYLFIMKDHIQMLGKSLAQYQVNLMDDNSDSFIFAFDNSLAGLSKTVKKNLLKKYFEDLAFDEYPKLLKSVIFWEFFPNLTGIWQKDKEYFINFVAERENKKEYIKIVLE